MNQGKLCPTNLADIYCVASSFVEAGINENKENEQTIPGTRESGLRGYVLMGVIRQHSDRQTFPNLLRV